MAVSDMTERPGVAAYMAAAERQIRLERGRNLGLVALLLVIVVFTYQKTEFDPGILIRNAGQLQRVVSAFAHPNTADLRDILPLTLETIYIAVLGTVIGTLLAIPLSFLAARNLMRRNRVGTAVYFAVRLLMSVIRSTPTLFWGIFWVIVVGIGPFPGVLAVSTFTVGLISKLFSEAIETVDWGQVDALTATGANPIQVVIHAVVPQVMPYMIANVLYCFEVNVHSSTVLGFVGAGGLGLILQQYIGLFLYPDLAMWLIVVVIFTSVIDYSSAAVRRRII